MRSTTPGVGASDAPADGVSAARRRGPRTRGRTALGRLPSTAAFDKPGKPSPLNPDERKLVLFLLVTLADDRGSLALTRRRLIDAYGSREGHWCAGKTTDSLLHLLAKSIGQGATSPPPWERIVDIVNAAVPRARRSAVLGQAAALFARSVGWDRPARGYDGPFSPPAWIDEPCVTVEMIVGEGVEPEEPVEAPLRAGPGPSVPAPRVPGAKARGERPLSVATAAHPIDDPGALRQVMLAMAETTRLLDQQVEALRESLKSHQVANWKLRSENQRQRSLLEQLLREKCPGVSTDTIRQLITEQLRSIITPDPPSPRPLHG
ncbi:hypothetical protein SAMN05421837_11240 [Amycolatopsis pretoriensis]|uniref:Uncharacterized protein n=1 Tax=Amycolatopsis pretoriensis TaxID=218821 RepID=A0A1H5RF67_9PSEU|nr:hypothetical protein [Amycolatopsis pretoriensis]SEF36929.1 hypothetical protein SAMN05421837_11240 [Amycolatopsis pretoriensis]